MASPGPTKRAMTSSNRYSLSPGPASSGGAPVLAFDDDKIRVACRVRPPAERDACSGVKGDTNSKVADGVLDQKYMDDAVRNKTRFETRGVWDVGCALFPFFFADADAFPSSPPPPPPAPGPCGDEAVRGRDERPLQLDANQFQEQAGDAEVRLLGARERVAG